MPTNMDMTLKWIKHAPMAVASKRDSLFHETIRRFYININDYLCSCF